MGQTYPADLWGWVRRMSGRTVAARRSRRFRVSPSFEPYIRRRMPKTTSPPRAMRSVKALLLQRRLL